MTKCGSRKAKLSKSDGTVEEDPQIFIQSAASLHGELGVKILGGCCGTDDPHIDNLAKRVFKDLKDARNDD